MAGTVTVVSNFLFSLLPTKSPPPSRQPNVVSLSSPQSPKTKSNGWTPLVACRFPPTKISSDDDLSLTSVVWPSLANANVLYFFNVQIEVADDEPEEKIARRFRSAVLRAGEGKRKARSAAQRNRKRRPKPKSPVKQKTPKKEGDDDEDDNWEVPDGDIPYC
ncbi:hypothetical protein CUMW_130950 [Citrus unshiu]|uniref:Uncharacterized protein n=1 Tax=Citrus unshiu TaxID=55188 RepID=A0A2H5PF60_CITUN|nr:hypothetical protein CUMW_130950 [Citrus unshiu]